MVHVSLLPTREKLPPPGTWEPNLYLPGELPLPITYINQERLLRIHKLFPVVVPFITLLPGPMHHVLKNSVLNYCNMITEHLLFAGNC